MFILGELSGGWAKKRQSPEPPVPWAPCCTTSWSLTQPLAPPHPKLPPSLSDTEPQDSPSTEVLHWAGAARSWTRCSRIKLILLQESHHWSHLKHLAGQCLGQGPGLKNKPIKSVYAGSGWAEEPPCSPQAALPQRVAEQPLGFNPFCPPLQFLYQPTFVSPHRVLAGYFLTSPQISPTKKGAREGMEQLGGPGAEVSPEQRRCMGV